MTKEFYFDASRTNVNVKQKKKLKYYGYDVTNNDNT